MPYFKESVTISPSVLEFLQEVQAKSKGYNIYLGGGYIRDLHVLVHGSVYGEDLEPKDVDIFVIPQENVSEKFLHLPAKGYVNFIKEAWEIPDMQKRGVSKVTGTWYKHLETSNVQFIEYEVFLDIENLASDMDMYINQCMYSIKDDEFFFTEGFLTSHKDEVISCAHTYDTVRMYKRYVRMEDKFWWYEVEGKPELGYEETIRLADSVNHEGSFCDSDEFDPEISSQSGKETWN
ncbi:hypothetical protein NVP1084O_023 [Vibrio phage 1.084.O._10N.261.49.F5]|nr:hypothetical protein NVP1084O_023 [Vibrio phage 1.084.O._10N.261.49.F5]